jgi:hypothetical protein
MFRLVDGSFPTAKSATLAGDNLGLGPKHFEWIRNDDQSGITFFTDICLEQALSDKSPKKVAWLIEPPEVSIKHYEFIINHMGLFSHVLSWDKELIRVINEEDKVLTHFYPFGGSWIRDWQLYPKSKLCSIIVSEKDQTEGQKLRHEIVKRFGDRIDVFGTGYNPIKSKLEALKDYQYSIVVENVKSDFWFTEKLIDCFATGTIPIYWGCPSIDRFFKGINGFETLEHLGFLLKEIPFSDSFFRFYKGENLEQAQKYRCTEDWIYENYPFLFEV